MIKIGTIEDFLKIRKSLEPIYVQSVTKGKIEVPCCNTLLVKRELIQANLYNPNSIPDNKMSLLCQSIEQNGYCFPVVAIYDDEQEKFVIIDGFHRNIISGPDWLDLDYVPLVCLKHNIAERMSATIQFNKARGVHQVDLDAEVVRALLEQGLTDEEVALKLGMEIDAVHRYKQITGIAELFKNSEYSMAWEVKE